MIYTKRFEQHSEYEEFISGGTNVYKPNVSVCEDNYHVHYNPGPPIDKRDDSEIYGVIEIGNIEPFSYEGGEQTGISLTTRATNTWVLTQKSDWLHIEPIRGTGNTTLTVEADEYDNTEENREGFFKVRYTMPDVRYVTTKYGITQEHAPDPKTYPLTFEILSSGTIYWKSVVGKVGGDIEDDNYNNHHKTIEYSKDSGQTWSAITSSTGDSAPTIEVVAGDIIQFRGNNSTYGTSVDPWPNNQMSTFSGTTAVFNIKGNIMSLSSTTSFSASTYLGDKYTFSALFAHCTGLTNASNLVLPATSLKHGCYSHMFIGCTSLIKAPSIIPATVIEEYSCSHMFAGCTALTVPPRLSATVIQDEGCEGMFRGCTSLTTAPELPATILARMSCKEMFSGCTGLINGPTSIGANATTIGQSACTRMFLGCTSLVNGPTSIGASATTMGAYCCSAMFSGCTSLVNGPSILPSSKLSAATACYSNMFDSCTSLTNIQTLPLGKLPTSAYTYMFARCTSLTTIPNNMLPATTLTVACYAGMFYGCTGLTTVPSNLLPATTVYNSCYKYMFYNCTSLTKTPNLPATTVRNYAYQGMFQNCTSLTTIPSILPPTTVQVASYANMFAGCKSLTTAPSIPATTIGESGCSHMFYYCTNLTNIPNIPATTVDKASCSYMFAGCEKITTVYVLPATSVTSDSYSHMFEGCKSLTTVPNNMLPATKLDSYCYYNMFRLCTNLTNAPELPATNLSGTTSGGGMYGYMCYSEMFYYCTSLTTAPELPATTLAPDCYEWMFQGCISLTTAPSILPATTLERGCYNRMFGDCRSLTTAPELPATTLAQGCYSNMFQGCTNLNYIKCLATDISASNCTGGWVSGVSYTGTFVKHPDMNNWTRGVNGIPVNWNVEDMSIDYSSVPLTFEIISDGNINWVASNTANTKTIEYSKDSGSTWTSITSTTGGTTIPVLSGETVLFRGNNSRYGNGISNTNQFKNCTCGFNLKGNIMSLINKTDFSGLTSLSENYCFNGFFSSNSGLVNASNLLLPATTLTQYCYYMMFSDCTSLTKAPELPSSAVSVYCYAYMFNNCTSLIKAPSVLPTLTLTADACYVGMFSGCTSLTSSPTIMGSFFYQDQAESMFNGCSSLNYVKYVGTNQGPEDFYTYNWLEGVSPTGTFVTLTGHTYPRTSSGIPAGWTIEYVSS